MHTTCPIGDEWGPLVTLRADTFPEFQSWSLSLETVFYFFFFFPCLHVELPHGRRAVPPNSKSRLSSVVSNVPRERALTGPILSASVNAIYWWLRVLLHLSPHLSFLLWWEWFCSCLIFWALRACFHLHFQFQVLHGKAASSWYLLKTGSAVTSIGQLSPSWSCPKYRALKQIRWRQISCVSCSEGLATSKWVQHGLFSGVHFPVANSAKERRDRCFEVGKTFLFCASVRHHVSNCLILLLRVCSYSVTPVDKWSWTTFTPVCYVTVTSSSSEVLLIKSTRWHTVNVSNYINILYILVCGVYCTVNLYCLQVVYWV